MTDKINMKEINEIRSQIGQLKQKLKDAQMRLEQAGLKAIGLSVGDRIKTKKSVIEVIGCEVSTWSDPRPIGLKVKKDGTTGAQSAGWLSEGEWELVE